MSNETNSNSENQKKTMKETWEKIKEEAHWKKIEAQTWIRENKDTLIALGIVLGPGVIRYMQSRTVSKRLQEAARHQRRSVYDPVHHHSYECKRDLKSYEWDEIDRRKDRGESVYDILVSMKLL